MATWLHGSSVSKPAEPALTTPQLIGPTEDGKPYGTDDARLRLDQGTPRFYIMRIPRRGYCFDKITYHALVTQCLGSLGSFEPWYLAVAAPTHCVERYPKAEVCWPGC